MAAVLGVVNLLSALTPNAHWRGHVLVAGRADRRHARLPCAGGARLGRAARRRVLPPPPPARCVAGRACPALRSRGPRHRQGARCRGGRAHGRGSRAALVGTGRVLRAGRPGAAALGRLARAGDRRGDDPPRRRRRRDRRAARRLRRPGSTRRFELLAWQPGELHLGDEGGHLPLALGPARARCARHRSLARVPAAGRPPGAARPGGAACGRGARPPARPRHARVLQAPRRPALPLHRRRRGVPRLPRRGRGDAVRRRPRRAERRGAGAPRQGRRLRPGSRPAARCGGGQRGSRTGVRGARPAAPLPRRRGDRRDRRGSRSRAARSARCASP